MRYQICWSPLRPVCTGGSYVLSGDKYSTLEEALARVEEITPSTTGCNSFPCVYDLEKRMVYQCDRSWFWIPVKTGQAGDCNMAIGYEDDSVSIVSKLSYIENYIIEQMEDAAEVLEGRKGVFALSQEAIFQIRCLVNRINVKVAQPSREDKVIHE